jgi:C4-dicarboxylate transporter
MTALDTLRYVKIPLTHGSGAIPALGFGTLIPDPLATEQATKTALEVGVVTATASGKRFVRSSTTLFT